MTEFAVRHKDDPADKGYWVFAVDPAGERLLIAGEGNTLRWVAIEDCIVIKAANPEMPRPVITLQPQQPVVLKRFNDQFNNRR